MAHYTNKGPFIFTDKNLEETAVVRIVIDKMTANKITIDITTQPISSFATDPKVSEDFARATGDSQSMLIQVSIPKERILGTCQTGFGCKNETEMVVLGGTDKVRAAVFQKMPYGVNWYELFGDLDK